MKSSHLGLVLPVLILIGSFNIIQSQQTPEKAAQKAAESWMSLMNSGKYAEAWDEASQHLKSRITKRDWESGSSQLKELHDNKSRQLVKAELVKSLPSVENQEGVVLEYKCSLEGKKIDETVEMVLVKDEWRVANYYATGIEPVISPARELQIPTDIDNSRPGNETKVDTRPVLLNKSAPMYTEVARRNNVQGTIRLSTLVDEKGKVKRAIIVEGLPHGLNEMALEAAYKMRFRPAMKNGQPVAYWLNNVKIWFSIRRG